MSEIESTNRQTHSPSHSTGETTKRKKRTQRQRTSASPESQSSRTSVQQIAPLDLHQPSPKPTNVTESSNSQSSVTPKQGAGNSNSLPGHQSTRAKLSGDDEKPDSSLSNLSRKKNFSTSDLDPFERKKQTALAKVEAKLEKAQRLHQKAQQSVEQEISEFLRITTIPNNNNNNNTNTTINNESNTSRTTSASFDKRIKALQDTKKELEKKITNYQLDISRIQAGDIPHNYSSSSKDILSNIKSTAAKVASGSLKHRTTNVNNESLTTASTPSTSEHTSNFYYQPENETHYHNTNLPPATTTLASRVENNQNQNQNLSTQNQHSNTIEPIQTSQSSSISNEIGNSQFYIDSTHEHIYDNDKSNRKYDSNVLSADSSISHDHDKSPSSNRRLTEDSNAESYDRLSDHSVDDRHSYTTSKRQTSTTTTDYQQLNTKIELMQKMINQYETKSNDMQKQIDSLVLSGENQREQNERLNNELTDLIEIHQIEMSAMKADIKTLEERLLYKFNDYWNELLDRLDKLDTRTAKVEQTQTHSLETEENTHRIISKLVNIVLTVFAIILILLSTIKNLVQSRVHAMTILILALVWITFHYLPPNYFQTSFLKNFPNMFKRTS